MLIGVVALCIQTRRPRRYAWRIYWGLGFAFTGGLKRHFYVGRIRVRVIGLVGTLSRATRSVTLCMHAGRRKARVVPIFGWGCCTSPDVCLAKGSFTGVGCFHDFMCDTLRFFCISSQPKGSPIEIGFFHDSCGVTCPICLYSTAAERILLPRSDYSITPV